MSLDITPTNLWNESQAALKNTRDHLGSYSRQIRQYAGKHYLGGDEGSSMQTFAGQEIRVENHSHDWLSLVLGRMVYDNPAVRVSTKNPAEQGEEAKLAHHAMNRWIPEHNFAKEFELCARDQQFNWGVALVSMEPVPDARPDEFVGGVDSNAKKRKKGLPWSPVFYRLSQRRYFWDPLAASERECRFQGHIWTRTRQSILKEAEQYPDRGWNVELVDKICMNADEHRKDLGREASNRLDIPERNEIVGISIWVKDRQVEGKKREDHFYGTWYTLALDPVSAKQAMDGGDSGKNKAWSKFVGLWKGGTIAADGGKYKDQYLREPYAYYGPPSGPYAVGTIYTVPDDPAGLGPLTVSQEAADELNLVSAANTASAKRWKRGVIVGGGDKSVVRNIKSGVHDDVFWSSKFDRGNLAEFQVSGLDPQGLEQERRMKEKLERSQGISDAQRGEVTGAGTATEVNEASMAVKARMDFIEKKVYQFAQNILEKVMWYIWHSNDVVIGLGPDAAEDLGMQPQMLTDENGNVRLDAAGNPVMQMPSVDYLGGPNGSDQETRYTDLELTIKPFSMQRTNDASQKANTMAYTQFLMEAVPMVRNFPEMDWQTIFDSVSSAMDQPEGAMIIDVEMSKRIGAMMLGIELEQLEAGMATPAGQSGAKRPIQFSGYAGSSTFGGQSGPNSAQMAPRPQQSPGQGQGGNQMKPQQPAIGNARGRQ